MPMSTPLSVPTRSTLRLQPQAVSTRVAAKVLPMTKPASPAEGPADMMTPELALALIGDMPTYDASSLTGKSGQARIVLGEQIYTLRITRAGKLILTK